MHTRRFASFLLGAWLLGSVFFLYVSSESSDVVSQIMSNPPKRLVQELEDLGPDLTRQTLEYQSSELERYLRTAWEFAQIGLGLALLTTSFLTPHRSRFVLIGATLMLGVTLAAAFYASPRLTALGRSFDFSSPQAHLQERQNYASFALTHRTLDAIKILLGIALTGRLLFDRATWNAPKGEKRVLRRRRRSKSAVPAQPAPEQVDAVDHADHGHING